MTRTLQRALRWPSGPTLKLHITRGLVGAFTALTFFSALVHLPLAEHPDGGGRIWQVNLAGTVVPRLLAGAESAVPIRINGGQQGTLSLAGSSAVLREALAGCYRF